MIHAPPSGRMGGAPTQTAAAVTPASGPAPQRKVSPAVAPPTFQQQPPAAQPPPSQPAAPQPKVSTPRAPPSFAAPGPAPVPMGNAGPFAEPLSANSAPSSNNVMQRPSVSSMMRSFGGNPPGGGVGPPMGSANPMGGGAMATPSTNCDISNTTENAMFPLSNHQPTRPQSNMMLNSQMQQQPQAPMGGRPQGVPGGMSMQQSIYQVS